MKKVTVVTAVLLAILFSGCFSQNHKTAWKKDIAYARDELPARHKNLFFKLSREQFIKEMNELYEKSDIMKDDDIKIRLMEIVAEIGDVHTNIDIKFEKIFPVAMYQFEDGLFVVGTDEKYKKIIGKKIVKIDGNSIESVYSKIKRVIPAENKYTLYDKMPVYAVIPEVMLKLGLINRADGISLEYEVGENKYETITIESTPVASSKIVSFWENGKLEKPLAEQNLDRYYTYKILKEIKSVYFQYNVCDNMKKNKNFRDYTEEMFRNAEKENIENIIIDLRNNRGGNSGLFTNDFVPRLINSRFNKRGNLYLIVGRATYSSGMFAAYDVINTGNALVFGEPTGNKPNHYGESDYIKLPESKLRIFYSKNYWQLSDSDRDALYPDFNNREYGKDYFDGKDVVMDAITRYIKSK